jgi:hypothetical protein
MRPNTTALLSADVPHHSLLNDVRAAAQAWKLDVRDLVATPLDLAAVAKRKTLDSPD